MSLRFLFRVSLLAAVLFSAVPRAASAADISQDFWHATAAAPLPAGAPEISIYRPLTLDVTRMAAHLAIARKSATAVTHSIPHPDGSYSEFLLVDSRVMPDALHDKFPDIVSLAGRDAAGRKARADISPPGFNVMVVARDGVFVACQ